ncbi:MAG: hypothetical protein RML14_11245 [Meiothermus sp.]|uniref:hypothetical protein n=1 Tax=Meiothermus sp. TaxID=1955249 RepID=UPI00298F3010|nr:hypothetical protein [Meiothermus sp.]MDW8482415.1 hypothetical protein [Meiothermus sp.]
MPVAISSLGFPRIGSKRELKFALENFWSGKAPASVLLEVGRGLRKANWARQHALGITHIPSNDFSFYDHVLDTSVMVGAIPAVYGWQGRGGSARALLRHGPRQRNQGAARARDDQVV